VESDSILKPYKHYLIENNNHVVEFVNKYLLLHDGLIDKFVISGVILCFQALNRWMEVQLREGIREIQITIDFVCQDKWKVP
jgi:hypothetical protein